ncbi:MAG: CYTH domain-containing protein [Erysipelotrichaceae bacterium]|nr:CYTH domain-containing protein [Erysipelotrichaceae bacterium]
MNNQERELKILLTKEQAMQLLNQIDFQKPRTQINTYYDNPAGFYKSQGIALRIRQIVGEQGNDQWILTIKKPLDAITKFEYEKETTAHTLEELSQEDINWIQSYIPMPNDLQTLASFKTERWIYDSNEAEISLDHTYFQHSDDYEIEYEYKSNSASIEAFNTLLNPLNIEFKKNCPSKLARAVQDQKSN